MVILLRLVTIAESTQTYMMSSVQAFAILIIAVTCNKTHKKKKNKYTPVGFAQP